MAIKCACFTSKQISGSTSWTRVVDHKTGLHSRWWSQIVGINQLKPLSRDHGQEIF